MGKIIPCQQFKLIRNKNKNKKIVLCHGVFDLIHPGHLVHLKEAKSKGDILVVTITADKYIHKDRRLLFNENLRANLLASLNFVDYVSIIKEPSAITPIKLLKPDYLAKGTEFKKLLQSSKKYNIHKEKTLLDKLGGQFYFTQKQDISPVKVGHLLTSASEATMEEPFYSKSGSPFYDLSSAGYKIKDINNFIKKAKNLKVAIVGENIIDRWVQVKLHGPSHKSSALSGKTVSSINQIGGAGIIALHVANFVKKVDFYTNDFPKIKKLPKSLKIFKIAKGKVITTRYVNQETETTLYVNHEREIKPIPLNFPQTLKKYDAVLVADFGYGLIDEDRARELSKIPKKFFACVVQSNSSNYGFNLPTKYLRANYFSLSQLEAELTLQKQFKGEQQLIRAVAKNLLTNYISITFGQDGAMISDRKNIWSLRSLSEIVKDPIGCGDAYFALSSLALATKQHPKLALLIGSVGAAIMAQRLCNEKPISQDDFLTAAEIII